MIVWVRERNTEVVLTVEKRWTEDVFKAEKKKEGGERYGESHYGPTRFYFSCKYEIFPTRACGASRDNVNLIPFLSIIIIIIIIIMKRSCTIYVLNNFLLLDIFFNNKLI